MEAKIRALESLGKSQENYNDVLVPIVLEKLPRDIREHPGHGTNIVTVDKENKNDALCLQLL